VLSLRSLSSKPHYIYFLLAAFDILTVCVGLWVSHTIMGAYTSAVAANASWNERLLSYSRLGKLAEAVDAPGNDVFDSHDPAGEERRMRIALDLFNRTLDELRAELTTHLAPERAAPLVERLDALDTGMDALAAQAQHIFSHFKAGRISAAGVEMATMDRKYAAVGSELDELRHAVGRIQQANFEQQMAAATQVEKYEYLVGLLVLLMVTAATFYGQHLAKQIKSHSARTEVVFKHELEAHEEKRKSVARELHEEVAQTLASLKLQLELLRLEAHAGRYTRVEDINSIVEGALERLREMVRDLTPHGMEELGLVPVLAAHLRDWTAGSGLRVHFAQSMLDVRPPPNIETAAYRIARELVHNTVRHARAASLAVELRQTDTELHLRVADDGTGFEVASATRQGSGKRLGLMSVEQRVALLGGKLQITSQPGGGTVARVFLPIADAAAGAPSGPSRLAA
jgi:signal transduction histidine kinase